jgi:hypothetical protein
MTSWTKTGSASGRGIIFGAVVAVIVAAVGLVGMPGAYSAPQPRPSLLTVQAPVGGTVTGPRINCPPACKATFSRNRRVTLTARPAAGFAFLRWDGACTGTGPTCTLRMNGNRTVSATFAVADPCPPVCAPATDPRRRYR